MLEGMFENNDIDLVKRILRSQIYAYITNNWGQEEFRGQIIWNETKMYKNIAQKSLSSFKNVFLMCLKISMFAIELRYRAN